MRVVGEFLIRKVGEGAMIPKGYGLAYWDFYRAEGVYYPIPFNLLARLWVRVYYSLMHGFYPNRFEAMLRREYESGFKEGAKHVSKQAIKAIEEIANVYRSLPFEERMTEAFIQSLEERQERLGKL